MYRNSTPGFPHGHQTLVVTRFHAAPTLIAEWGTASVARLAPPLGQWMDRTQCSMWVAAPPPQQGPLVRGLTIAFNMYVHHLVYAVGKQTNKQSEHPTFHIVYRNSTPGFPHGHQTLVVTRFHTAPTLIGEWGTASVARLAAPLAESMDPTQCSMWVAAAPPLRGPLVRGLTIAFNMYVRGLVCGLRLATLDAGDTPAPPLNNTTISTQATQMCVGWGGLSWLFAHLGMK